MYIAFKWLTALAMALWLGLCCFDIFVKEYKKNTSDFTVKQYKDVLIYNNVSAFVDKTTYDQEKDNWKFVKQRHVNQQSMSFLHYVTFLCGVFAVSLFNKKNAILKYVKMGLSAINVPMCPMSYDINMFINNFGALYFKRLATTFSVARLSDVTMMWGKLKAFVTKAIMSKTGNVQIVNSSTQHENEIGQQPKKVGQLLLAAIEENKKIRLQYQMEKTSKDKLVRYIGETIKESRTQYVSFQQLYLVTHTENIFLKSRIRKLTNEKDTAENNLISLINEVYRSKDTGLKAYCTRFIVHTKKNLLNSDVRAEIRKFLQKSQKSASGTFTENVETELGIKLSAASSLPGCSSRITEVFEDDNNLVSVICNEPNLIGLPGEYIFTVKDKNGITKKMYEYKIDYNNAEEIRNLRQYTVYEDKSCLLDQKSELPEISPCSDVSTIKEKIPLDLTLIKNQRFLTDSEQFKIFLRNSPVSLTPRLQMPALPCG